MKSIGLSLIIAAQALIGALAQPLPANPNPALLYYQAFMLAPDPMPEADMDYLYSNEGRSQKLPDRFGDLFAKYDNQFALLRTAARSTAPCDWGIDMSEGPGTLLPHLAPSKAAALACRLRVPWNLQQGRQAAARDDLLASFKLARNLTRDGTFISVLVQFANEIIDCSTLAENFGRFPPETLQQLVEGLESGPARGTIAGCVPTEKAIFEDWLLRQVEKLRKANPGDDAKVMAGLHGVITGLDGSKTEPPRVGSDLEADENLFWKELNQASGGSSEGVIRLVRDAKSLDQQLAAILALPRVEFEAQMQQFKTRNQQSPNPCFARTLPQWERGRQRELKVDVYLAMVRAAVEYKLHGQAGLQSVRDPFSQGPFAFRRFVFQGVDRGFELTSACTVSGWPEVVIFVETEGPAFYVNGRPGHVGQPVLRAGVRK